MIECVSTGGKANTPKFILPGLFYQEQWFTHSTLDDNCLLATTESRYVTDKLSVKWLHHFTRQTASTCVRAWSMLLLVGYAFYCTYEFIQYCD